jgi:hypothetical protein
MLRMSVDVLEAYEALARADLDAWFGDASRELEIARRATSISIALPLGGVVLERWAELRDGMVGDALVFTDGPIPRELVPLVRRSGARSRIDSYDRRLDGPRTFGALPPSGAQHVRHWSATEIASAVEASSTRIRAIWEALGRPGLGT